MIKNHHTQNYNMAESLSGIFAATDRREPTSEPDCFVDVVGRVSGERVVEVPDEVVFVLILQRHEGPAHHDELHLVYRVAKLAKLVHAVLRLQVRVVSANLDKST